MRNFVLLIFFAALFSCSNDPFATECIVCDSVTVCQDYYDATYRNQSNSLPASKRLMPWDDYKQFCDSLNSAKKDSLLNAVKNQDQ